MDTLKIYAAMALASLRARLEYKVAFFAFLFAVIFFYLAQLGALLVVMVRFKEINGWDMGQMAFLFGLLTFSQGFAALFFNGLANFDRMLIGGEFDRTLVRPLSPLAQIIVSKFEVSTVAHGIIGSVALYYGAKLSGIHWTFWKAAALPAVIFGGVLIQGGIRLAVTAVAFWTLKNESLVHTVVFSGKEFVVYPITIYNDGIRFFLTFIFPLAFVNFYPAQYFLDKRGETLFHPALQGLTPLVGVIVFSLSLWAWKAGVDHYQSSGS
ncbi:MAG: ABC-2 family transporter protein [Nitrospinae bacterium]|nr:ABC-2 family transporter protein [Nitrospinota bacterium]